ncbi:MAG: signal peptide peptidase SppA, partial [Cyanobacteria bacterium J06641_5]
PPLSRFLPGRSAARGPSQLATAWDWVEFELATSGQPLWLYRP